MMRVLRGRFVHHSLATLGGSFGLAAAALWAIGCTTQESSLPAAPPIVSGQGEAGAGSASKPGVLPGLDAQLMLVEPERLRIHPLSRLERDERGELRLTCHLEVVDRWGQSVKWLGRVRVELYQPTNPGGEPGEQPAMSGGERQSKYWEVDLTEPAQNALMYDDLVTRSYILPLVDLPDWVGKLEQGTSREPWLTLRAYFVSSDKRGRERILETSARIRREGAR